MEMRMSLFLAKFKQQYTADHADEDGPSGLMMDEYNHHRGRSDQTSVPLVQADNFDRERRYQIQARMKENAFGWLNEILNAPQNASLLV